MSLGDIVLTAFISGFAGMVFNHWYLLRRIQRKPYQDSTHTYTAVERSDNIK